MPKSTFWTRLGQIFRPGGHGAPDLPPIGEDGLLAGRAAEELGEPAVGTSDRLMGRWSRRDQALQQLQEGYQRITDLIDAMQRHMADQGARTDRIATSLDQLARALSDLPAIAREQTHTLDAIASHLEMTNARTQHLAECIRDLPAALKSQSEATAGVSRQLELGNESRVHLNNTMQTLGRAVDSLQASGRAQADLLRQCQLDGAEREGRLAEIVARQQRRFTFLAVAMIVALFCVAVVTFLALRGRL